MRTIRVYIDARLTVGEKLALDKAQVHYLKHVLRLNSGAAFRLFDGRHAVDYEATLTLDTNPVQATISSAITLNNESGLGCEVLQALGRSDHMDWMIQKTTELGVGKISIFNAEHTQTRIKSAQIEKKLSHWRGVAISACEQCGRAVLPKIEFHNHLHQALASSSCELKLLLDFDGRTLASTLQPPPSSLTILLGPEGGLNQQEIGLANDAGFEPVRLGPRVLRTETAATAAVAIAQFVIGDMN